MVQYQETISDNLDAKLQNKNGSGKIRNYSLHFRVEKSKIMYFPHALFVLATMACGCGNGIINEPRWTYFQ